MLQDGLVRGRATAGGRDRPVPGGMLETAENLRREYGISRTEQDELAVTSHERAVAAQKNGVFAEEIVRVTVRGRKNDVVVDTTSTRGPGPRSSRWRSCARCWAAAIPRRPSPPVTHPGRTTPPRYAW